MPGPPGGGAPGPPIRSGECGSPTPKGGRGNPFSSPKPGPGKAPGKPGIPKGGPGRPAAPAFMAAEAAAAAAAAADVGVVGGLGVVGLSLPLLLPGSADFFPDGAGVEEADDRPDLGLTGSFLALRSPFSLGGVLRRPLVKACTLLAIRSAALISGPATSIFCKIIGKNNIRITELFICFINGLHN